jgi:DNA mismatch endonuclease (patch repair protein)
VNTAGSPRRLTEANRRKDTNREVALGPVLHRLGYRFGKDLRLDFDGVKVRRDIAFTRRKITIFVDGCFWHACPLRGREPTTNEWYWTPKLRRTAERDRAVGAALAEAGWAVLRGWEHEPVADAVARSVHVRTYCRRQAERSLVRRDGCRRTSGGGHAVARMPDG